MEIDKTTLKTTVESWRNVLASMVVSKDIGPFKIDKSRELL